ncbi:MAG: DedA family protein [Deltaproteobacteria bacterium]|nr:DedA family protein [Deltaproteobacteria bacterium]
MEAFIASVIQKYLYAGVFVLLLACGLGVPMPEDVILVTGGYISYLYPNNVNLWTLVAVSMAGVLVGDSIIFMAGRHFGPRVVTLWPFRKVLTPARLSKMEGYFRSYGNKIVFAGRFMAGIRAPLFMTAGISRHPYWRFLLFDALAAMISVPVWVLSANYFGEEIDRLKHMLVRTQKALFIIVPLVIIVWVLYRRFARRREEEIEPWDRPDSRW